MSSNSILKVTRESLANGAVAKMVAERADDTTFVASDDDLLASRRALIPDDFDCQDIWVFGYGSLIFNPVLDHTKKLTARAYGHHRRFCLWTRIGRGSPDCPGLVLALDHGGSCTGVAFKLRPENAISEIDLLWRREMISMAYRARWMRLHTDEGVKTGIAFIALPGRPNYAQPMELDDEAGVIATASGFIGHCRDYLFDTVDGLHNHGIRDRHLENLVAAVKARLAL
ncbi:gamma-glutamylcyclotransferase [bacterium]|nr:gamma-glutamylcyclotransferase [bacterium]